MDITEQHRRAVALWAGAVRAVGPAQWHDPTPCTDWDVRTLVNHVVGEDRWTVPLMGRSSIQEVGSSLDGDLLGDDPVAAAVDAADAAVAATGPALAGQRQVQLSYGPESAAEYAAQLTADHLVHGWDLLVAIGADAALPDDLVADLASWFADREGLYRQAGMIAEPSPLPADPTPQDRLLAAFGRDPRWTTPARAT